MLTQLNGNEFSQVYSMKPIRDTHSFTDPLSMHGMLADQQQAVSNGVGLHLTFAMSKHSSRLERRP